jgi:hypothetical protein
MSHRASYWIVGGVMAVLLVIMLVTYNYNRSNEQALAKAQQLNTAFEQAGLPTRDPAEVARVFGTDGGAVCASVQNGVALGIAKLNLSVGGAFYTRAVIADKRLATGLLLVVQTYCPEKVPTAQEFIDAQQFANVAGG